MSLDWHAALTVVFGGIVICQAGALHTAWEKRDRYWNDSELLRRHNRDLTRERDIALSQSNVRHVVFGGEGGLDEKAETYDPGSAS